MALLAWRDKPILSKADKLPKLGIEAQSAAAFAANP